MQDEYRDEPGSVIAADFYHSNALMAMDDADIVARVHRNLCICEPGFSGAKVRHPSNADPLLLASVRQMTEDVLS